MKTTLVIIICKLVTFVCHIFRKNGTVFPGEFAHKFSKNILDNIHYPEYVIAVTGSSGKGSTVAMTSHILEKSGKKVIWNKSGSNVKNAITTLVLNNTKIFSHKMNADVLLLECDERFIASMFKPGVLTHLVITNVTRDQPARNVHPNFIYEKILESVTDENMHLIINADDPLLNRIKYSYEGKVTTFGVAETKYDSKETPTYAIDFAYCPSCHNKLKYSSYHYGHMGIYECSRCSFKRGIPDYEAKNIDLEKNTIDINGNTLKLNKGVFFAIYYTTLAYAICMEIGIDKKDILREINDDAIASKRGKTYEIDNRTIEMLESKNENALSYLQSLSYIKRQKGKKTVVMGFENVSRRYRFNDLSWLWDVDFELLNDKDVDKIFLIGRFKYDVYARLDYANIDTKRLVLVDDMSKLFDMIVEESKGNIYTMVCFDMTEIITNLLKEREYEENN